MYIFLFNGFWLILSLFLIEECILLSVTLSLLIFYLFVKLQNVQGRCLHQNVEQLNRANILYRKQPVSCFLYPQTRQPKNGVFLDKSSFHLSKQPCANISVRVILQQYSWWPLSCYRMV